MNKHEKMIYGVFHSAPSSPFRDILPVAGLEAKRDEVPAVALVEEPKMEPVVVPDVAPKFDVPERKDHFRFRISSSLIYILTMIISRFHILFNKLITLLMQNAPFRSGFTPLSFGKKKRKRREE